MSDKRTFFLVHAQARNGAHHAVAHAPEGYVCEIKPKTRSLEQNARMWAMLADVSKQVDWYGKKLAPEDWKHVFSASLRKLDVVPNLDGTGFVALGMGTSQMTIREINDLMTLMGAFGAERGVRFTMPEEAFA